MIKNFIFLGAPGVGKGTLASLLSKNKGMKHISTGEIFRDEIKNQTKLGIKVKSILDSGEYVPDEITNEIIKNVLQSKEIKKAGFILDGYPRTLNQAIFLEENNINIDKVVLLNAPEKLIIERLLSRGRTDDNIEVIENRIHVYNEKTKPLIDFYQEKKLIVEIDSSGSLEKNLSNLLKGLYNDKH